MIIKNGKIHVGNGNVLEGYDILIANSKIEKIDKNIINDNETVVDAQDKEVFPGFIDPVSSFGCMDLGFSIRDINEISEPITPKIKIKYAFNHKEIMLEELYKVGITTIGASPGNQNIIGGKMTAFKTWGKNSNQMLIKEDIGLKGSVLGCVKEQYGKRKLMPMTKMGIFAKLEEFFINNTELYKNTPLFINANKQAEIISLLKLVEKYKVKLVIVGAYQLDKCLDEVKKSDIGIILGDQIYLTARNYNNTDLYRIAKLQDEGKLVSFTLTGDYGPNGKVNYLWNAMELYKAGVDSERIITMMTQNPAKIIGIDDVLGTIEEGKYADLVIYTKNPIKYYDAKVTNTIIEGKIVVEEELRC